MNNNKILFFIGPSGSGKDTFVSRILNKYQISSITLLTTRPIRDGEKDGREYFFISDERMDLLEKRNLLIERRDYNTIHGVWSYATGKEQIKLEEKSYITPNTWKGYESYLKYYSQKVLIPFYFSLDDGIRLERCLEREKQPGNGKYAEMCRRFLTDKEDFKKEYIDYYKPYVIDNNFDANDTMAQIDDIFVHKLEIKPKENTVV